MFPLKPFPFSIGCPNRGRGGFTLIELVVVMALVGIMLLIAVPNFQHLLTDDSRKASQWILLQVPKFKARAISEHQVYFLHVDMDRQRLWFSNGSMSDDEQALAMEEGFQLSDTVRIVEILFASEGGFNAGEAIISFYPKGYSDKAIVHMEGKDEERLSFVFEPFLNQVAMTEGYVGFED